MKFYGSESLVKMYLCKTKKLESILYLYIDILKENRNKIKNKSTSKMSKYFI